MVGDLLGLDEDDDYLAHASRAALSSRPPPVEPPGDVALLDESERESEEEDLGAALSRAEAAAAAPLSPYRDELPSRRVPPPSSSVETVRDAMDEAGDPMVPLWQQSAKQQPSREPQFSCSSDVFFRAFCGT